MSNQEAELWSSKYQTKSDQAPPPIYDQVKTAVLAAKPGEASPGQTAPRLPQEHDFPKYIENRILASNAPKEDIQYIIIVLHGYAADNFALGEFAKKHLLGPRTACVLLRGSKSLESDGTYCWSDQGDFIGGPDDRIRALRARESWQIKRRHTGHSSIQSSIIPGPSRSNTMPTGSNNLENVGEEVEAQLEDEVDENDKHHPTFKASTEQIGLDVITNVLIKKCGFLPSNIALVGHDQGGSAALAVAAACWATKFGGVVSIGGIMPSDFPDDFPNGSRAPTHVLLLGGKLGDLTDKEVARIESTFSGTTKARKPGKSDDFEDIEDLKLKEFLAHQLRREEWTKEAVVTFDGGGIRGYGSLLMLSELMSKIAECEKELDRTDVINGEPVANGRSLSESSFSPCEYPPIEVNGKIVARNPDSLDDDQLYLPCHYFTFIGGTSTGGLISIMLSRFRMTVRDCIKAYKHMGRRVFGNPRAPDFRLLWHKFDADRLEKVIRDVVSLHGEIETKEGDIKYPSDESLCKTIVAARANKGSSTVPFLFRTYDCRTDATERPNNPPLNAGRAAQCSIVEVGRATSAAPNFFRPIEIKNWGAEGYENRTIQFIDGGFGLNNPSHEILKDIKRKLKAPNAVFDVFASFGTGLSNDVLQGSLSTWKRMVREMKREMTDVLRAHQAMENECGTHSEDGLKTFEYFRFDGGEALGKIKMDEWSGRRKNQLKLSNRATGKETLESMDNAIKSFLKKPETKKEMARLANILVLRRRLRTRDKKAWERYACASRYECNQEECNAECESLGEFELHLNAAHSLLPTDVRSTAIKNSKRCWVYRGNGEED